MNANLLLYVIMAAGGTIGFSLLFGVPVRYYPYCGLIGGIGYLLYVTVTPFTGMTMAAFFSAVAVILMSRWCAVRKYCPVTIFLISGIIPLVPGAGIYRAAYYTVTGQLALAGQTGFNAIKIVVAIVLGIVFVFELPQQIFRIGFHHKEENK